MSFELRFQRNQPKPPAEVTDPIQEELRRVGVYVVKGNRFDSRVSKIHEAIENEIDQAPTDGLSDIKTKLIMKSIRIKQALFDSTLPYGVAIDNPQYRALVDSVMDILTLYDDIVFSDASDENCSINCRDLLQNAGYKVMGKTWKESHVVGDTPLVVHQTQTKGGEAIMDEETKQALIEAKRQSSQKVK